MNNKNESVILLHGLARRKTSFLIMEKALTDAGYHTVNFGYPSRKSSISTLAEDAINSALKSIPDGNQVHFVTHSMGGILVRQYLSQFAIPMLGRVVMLGPPNQGSEVVDALRNVPGFKWFNGPAGLQLGTDKLSLLNKLGPANFDVGVIAGTRSVNLMLSRLLPFPNDGKVSVESTKLEGMKDHLCLPVTHTFMMMNPRVIKRVLTYLKFGHF
ncbi:esterase/lipase family protein [Litoribacillus peritrichatus]|uniref:Alpha/beta fold hydrolase n=1 Tax=Litoribacillus peritrichatus TaxID=718191 RepID=A0ABP7M9Z1_9GAMM